MNPLNIATEGFLSGTIGIATSGYIDILTDIIISGGGGSSRRRYSSSFKKKDNLANLLRDDDDLLTIIISMITGRIL